MKSKVHNATEHFLKHSVHPPPLSAGRGRGVEHPMKFSKGGELDRISIFFEGGGGGGFYIKTKIYKQKCFFSVITKTLYWEILTENAVTFKRWDGDKVSQKTNIWGNCPKMVAWTVCRFKGRGLSKKRGGGEGVFQGGWHPNAHYVKEEKIKGKHFLDLWTATGTVAQVVPGTHTFINL